MGTRGLFGFHFCGKYYVVYNQFDSYPSGLGRAVISEIQAAIKSGQFSTWLERFQSLKIVSLDGPKPTPDDIKKLLKYSNLQVSTQSTDDWYCLLRGCQFSLEKILESGYLLNAVDKEGRPHWQEYAYVVNFDTNRLDFYDGDELKGSYTFDALPNWTVSEDSEDIPPQATASS